MDDTFRVQTLNNIAMAGLERLPRDRYEVGSSISEPDAILLRSQDMRSMDLPPSLLAVGRAGAGVNNIPVDRLTARGVPVFNAPGANANAVKELVLGSLFLAARNLVDAAAYVRGLTGSDEEVERAVEAGKKEFVGFELPRRTLGVVGLGAIGVEVANAALHLGMKVIGYDPKITVNRAWQLAATVEKAVSLGDLFARADVVTLHVPLNDDTRHLVNRERLRALPKGSILLNFARDEVVDVPAVIDALENGNLRTFITDFPANAIRDHPQVICLPHLGASTTEAEENCAIMVAENVKDFLENGNVRHSVNFPETTLPRARPHRIAIPHANKPNMVAQILTALGEQDLNIADMINNSRGEISYTLVDLDGPVDAGTASRIKSIGGILCVRILPEGGM